MSVQESARAVRVALAEMTATSADDWFLAFRTRHAMLVAFEALRAQCGAGEVVTQLFTCCTAVDPIIAAGLTPRYGDISARTLALDPAVLPLSPQTRAVVDQHTFGMIDAAASAQLRDAAHAAGALLVEDSAHCVGHMATDPTGAPLADLSFHSFGIGKMASAGFGGAVWVSPALDPALRAVLVSAFEALPVVAAHLERATGSYDFTIRVLMHLPQALRRVLWDQLASAGLFIPAVARMERAGKVFLGASAPGEATCAIMGEGMATLPTREVNALGALAVFDHYFDSYEDALGVPGAARKADRALLRYPLVLDSEERADELVQRLCDAGFYVDPWGRPLLYPGALEGAAYGLDEALPLLPVTQRCSCGVVPLATNVSTDEALTAAKTVFEFLREKA